MTSQFLSPNIWDISTCLLSASQTNALTVHMSILVTEHDKLPPSSFNVQTVQYEQPSGRSIQLIVPWQDDSSNWEVSNDTVFLFGIWCTLNYVQFYALVWKKSSNAKEHSSFANALTGLCLIFLPIYVCRCYYHHIEGRDSSVGTATR